MEAGLRKKVDEFVRVNIVGFHQWRAKNISNIKLHTLINNKNPYLFRAKNLNVVGDLISVLLAARLSSAEEGVFGNFLEGLAIFVVEETGRGHRSGIEGINIELADEGVCYLIAVKSGRKSNAQSLKKQAQDFMRAKEVIKQSGHVGEISPVLGICYGNFQTRHTGEYLHIAGQSFWHLLSGDPNLYVDIVAPLGHGAQGYADEFEENVANLTNRLTREFTGMYCKANGAIDWPRLVQAVSGNMESQK